MHTGVSSCWVVWQVCWERYTRVLMEASLKFPIHFLKIYSSVIGPLLLAKQAVPGDDMRQDLAQTSPMLRGQRGPERWQRHLLGARDLGGTERHRRGGAWSGVHIRPLLTDRRADVDTTGTASTKPLH